MQRKTEPGALRRSVSWEPGSGAAEAQPLLTMRKKLWSRVGELGERHARHQSLPRHRAFMRISSGHDMPPSAQVVTVDTRLSYLVQGTPR